MNQMRRFSPFFARSDRLPKPVDLLPQTSSRISGDKIRHEGIKHCGIRRANILARQD